MLLFLAASSKLICRKMQHKGPAEKPSLNPAKWKLKNLKLVPYCKTA